MVAGDIDEDSSDDNMKYLYATKNQEIFEHLKFIIVPLNLEEGKDMRIICKSMSFWPRVRLTSEFDFLKSTPDKMVCI